jgi:predicted 3-demethylubiquinone-9 3-methyltransferase (glyoxalase superfamily)
MRKMVPCLWFDDEAEEAASFYVSIFPNSTIGTITRYSEEVAKVAGGRAGSVLTVTFTLDGNEFLALNGGPAFKFNESVSFMIHCDTQEEIDHFWDRLTAGGGAPSQCGWLKDRYGVSWQVVPRVMDEMMAGDPRRHDRMMSAMLPMTKLDIATLQRAYDEEP